MNLIPQWQQLWKMYSVQLAAVLVALNTAAYVWPSFQALFSPEIFSAVNGLLAAAIAVVRAIPQANIAVPADKPSV